MGNKIRISSMGFLYQIVIMLGLSVTSYAYDGIGKHVYNLWSKNAYKYNEPMLSEIKGQNIESYRFVYDRGEWGLGSVIRITKHNNTYMFRGMQVGDADFGYDGKGILTETEMSEEEWNILSNYIYDLSYKSMSPQDDDYTVFDASYIILEGIKNGKYYYVGRYSPTFETEERKLEKFKKALYRFQKYFHTIDKDKTRDKVVIDLNVKYKKRKAEEALRIKQQEEERKRLYADEIKIKIAQKLWESVHKGSIYPLGYFKDFDANIKNSEGRTPLMLAAQNGYSDVIRSLSNAKVNVWQKDNEGKTAFDYVGTSTKGMKEFLKKRVYGALRVLEVEQLIRKKAKIMHYSYTNDTDLLSIVIRGSSCNSFSFPRNTTCKSLPKKKKTSHTIFHAIKSKDNVLFDEQLELVDLSIKNKSNYSLLWAAIFYKNLYAVDKVLKKGANMNEPDSNNLHIPISWAIIQNDVSLLQVLLDNGVDVNAKGKFGNPVLFKAMYKCKSFETIALLLANGANPYIKNKRGKTVFDREPAFCKDKAQIEKMRKLLSEGSRKGVKKEASRVNKMSKMQHDQAESIRKNKKFDKYLSTLNNLETKNAQGYTPLHAAVATKHYYAIKKLLKKGADMYILDGQYGVWTPFNYTVAINDQKAVKIFLEYGADINFHHSKGSTILNDAVRKCEVGMVKLLLENGANPRIKDAYGYTAMSAGEECDTQSKKEIKDLFDTVLVKGKNSTLLKVGKLKFKIEEQKDKSAKKRQETKNYKKTIKKVKDPIFTAIAYKKNHDFDGYLNTLDNIELTNSNRKTLLYVAVEEHNYYAIDKLLQKDADINSMEEYWTYTPFTYASARNDLKAVQMFLDKGADANYQYKKSLTLLALAVKQCNIEMIQLLLDHGASTTLKDKRGDNAIASLGHCNKKDNKKIASLINNEEVK